MSNKNNSKSNDFSIHGKSLDDSVAGVLIVEQYLKGREFSVGVINGDALPVIEIAPKEGFYDYKNKYQAGAAVETCPAEIDKLIGRIK